MRGGLYGLGPVVLGIFIVAVYRLGRASVKTATHAVIGLAAAAASVFSPLGVAAILTLSVLPMFERVRGLVWMKAAMEGVGPAVIGVVTVSLVRLAPHALPDPFAAAIPFGTLVAQLGRRVGPTKLMLAGGLLGVLRSRLTTLSGARVPL